MVKNPLSPVEHTGGVGVNCEMFNLGLEQFIVSLHFARKPLTTDLADIRMVLYKGDILLFTHSSTIYNLASDCLWRKARPLYAQTYWFDTLIRPI